MSKNCTENTKSELTSTSLSTRRPIKAQSIANTKKPKPLRLTVKRLSNLKEKYLCIPRRFSVTDLSQNGETLKNFFLKYFKTLILKIVILITLCYEIKKRVCSKKLFLILNCIVKNSILILNTFYTF